MRIGVVIPCLNGERYLAEALRSVAAQTLPPDDVVLVDDGSTDASADIARRHGARVVRTPAPRSGTAVAREIGVATLDTPLIAFLDADDRWTPRKLELQRAVLATESGVDAVVGGVRQFLSEDRPDLAGRVRYGPSAPAAPFMSALLIRREAWERAGGAGVDGVGIAETVDFFRRARASLRIASVDAVVFERRVHGGNVTFTHPEQAHADYLRAARRAILARRAQAC